MSQTNYITLPLKVEIAQWWKDIREPLIQLQLDFGVTPDIEKEIRILKEATTITYGKVKI